MNTPVGDALAFHLKKVSLKANLRNPIRHHTCRRSFACMDAATRAMQGAIAGSFHEHTCRRCFSFSFKKSQPKGQPTKLN